MRRLQSLRIRAAIAVIACTLLLGVATPPPAFTEQPVTLPIDVGHLDGTLTLPSGSGPFPVALIIAGSGPTDRDGNSAAGLHTDAYKLLAHDLAANGIATLRYDKREIGTSTVTQTESALRFDDYVADANALAHLLENDKRFRSVAVIGHSEGSLIGILAAERDARIRGVVTLEGAGRNLADILDEQVRAGGAPPQIVNEVVSIDQQLKAGKLVPSPDPQLAALFRPSVQPYLISEYRYDPAVEIAKLTLPVLIVQGSNDIQVGIADAQRLAHANPHTKLAVIPGMNHILRDAPADRQGNIATYSQPTLPLNTTVVSTISSFLTTQ